MNQSSDYSATIAKKLFLILSGTAAAALIARFLGPEMRAQYAYIQNGAAIVVVILNFGFSNYYQSLRRENGPHECVNSIALTINIFLLSLVGSALLGGLIGLSQHAILIVACFSLLRLQFQAVSLVENIRGASVATILGSSVEVICIIFLWTFVEPSALWVVGGFICKELAITILSLKAIAQAPDQIALRNGPPLFSIKNLMRVKVFPVLKSKVLRSVPMLLLTVSMVILYKADVLIQSTLGVDPTQIGIYVIGVVLAEYLWIFSDIFKDVQTSRTARGQSAHGVATAHRCAIFATLIFYTLFIVFGYFAVIIVFGSDFSDSYRIAIIMLIANIFMIPAKILGTYLISVYHIRSYIICITIALALNIGFNFAFIPLWGIYGSLAANILSYMVGGVSVMLIFMSHTDIPLKELLLISRKDIVAILAIISKRGAGRATPPTL